MPLPGKIGVIGHDLVGAIFGTIEFTHFGLQPIVVLDGKIPGNCEVISLATGSKIASPRMAYLQTRKAIARCRGRFVFLYENLFLMGNISADIKALFDELQPEKLVFCTAWPELNSLILGGIAYIGDIPVNKTSRASDVITPIKEAYIPSIVEKYTGLTSKLITLEEVEQGPGHIAQLIEESSHRIVVCDATERFHLKNIAEAIGFGEGAWLACGSRGLITEMPCVMGYEEQRRVILPLPNKEPVLLIIGSLSDVSALRLAIAAEKGILYPVMVEPAELWNRGKREQKINKLAREAGEKISKGNNVAITSTCSRFIPQFRKVAASLLASIAKQVIEEYKIRAIFVSGADTAYSFCRALQVYKIEVKGSINEGISTSIAKAYTSRGETFWLGIRGGSGGEEEEIIRVLQFMRNEC